jgi:uncharacterized membrane protein YgcG
LQVFDCFTHPLSIRQAFEMDILKNALKEVAEHYEKELIFNGLLIKKNTFEIFKTLYGLSIVVVLFVGMARLVWALSAGHSNVGFLIMLSFLALIINISLYTKLERITKQGKKYLKDLRLAFSTIQKNIKEEYAEAKLAGVNTQYLPLVSVFGLATLSESDDYQKLAKDSGSGSSCGSIFGCGSSDGGSSGSNGSNGSSCSSSCGSGCGGG